MDGGISGDIPCLESKSGIRVVGSIPTPSAKYVARSSNGRTLGSDPSTRGSNPRRASKNNG